MREGRRLCDRMFLTLTCAVASYDYFHDSDSLDRDFYTLHMVYCALNLVNDFIGLVAVWRASLMGLSLFLTCELLMTIFSTVASFSPLVLFHLLILLLTIQNRMYISRVGHMVPSFCPIREKIHLTNSSFGTDENAARYRRSHCIT